jgi:hypothetical protein
VALHDYDEIDEGDFYGQGFTKAGVVSIWLGLTDLSGAPKNLDLLQDLCGVGYYDIDDQENNFQNYEVVPLADLMDGLSYSPSFKDQAIHAASKIGITNVRWVLVQFDFEYDPARVKRSTQDDPVFLGVFPYSTGDE